MSDKHIKFHSLGIEVVLNKKLYSAVDSSVISDLCSFTVLGMVICSYSLWWCLYKVSDASSDTATVKESDGEIFLKPPKRAQLQKKENVYPFCYDLMFSEYSLLCLAIYCPANFLADFSFLICLKKSLWWHFMSFSSYSSSSFPTCLPMHLHLTCQIFLLFSIFLLSVQPQIFENCLLTSNIFHSPDIKSCQLTNLDLGWSMLLFSNSIHFEPLISGL